MITNYVFFRLVGKPISASVPGGSEILNTHVGPEAGWEANGVEYAHHKWIGHFKKREFEEALEWNKKACEIRSNDPRSGHPDTIAEKRSRALILAYLGKYDDAISDISQTLDECEAKPFSNAQGSEILFETMDEASTVHKLAGRYVLADVLSEKACKGYEAHKEKFGVTHPAALSAMLRRAMLLKDRKKLQSAKEWFDKAYICQKESDPPDFDGIFTMYQRARLFEELKLDKSSIVDAFTEVKETCDQFLKKPLGDEDEQNVSDILDLIPPWALVQ
jgi:tetratricopeptide (TPR) repeat protein